MVGLDGVVGGDDVWALDEVPELDAAQRLAVVVGDADLGLELLTREDICDVCAGSLLVQIAGAFDP